MVRCGRDMKKMLLFLAAVLVIALTACASDADISPNYEPLLNALRAIETEDSQTVHEQDETVTMEVYKIEYILSDEDAEFINVLFYNHETVAREGLTKSVATIKFHIGEDSLYTSFDRDELEGTIGGEMVFVELTDSEHEALHELILSYTQTLESPDNSDISPENEAILIIHNGWDDIKDVKIPDTEYILSSEDAEFITDLFYNHEYEVLDSPTQSIATITLNIGDDYLSTSLSSNHPSGIVGGELILVRLTDSEVSKVDELILSYAPDIEY
jgi:hypothetical protein